MRNEVNPKAQCADLKNTVQHMRIRIDAPCAALLMIHRPHPSATSRATITGRVEILVAGLRMVAMLHVMKVKHPEGPEMS
jgi:hypothetical protein